jgi:hypothetical protein
MGRLSLDFAAVGFRKSTMRAGYRCRLKSEILDLRLDLAVRSARNNEELDFYSI